MSYFKEVELDKNLFKLKNGKFKGLGHAVKHKLNLKSEKLSMLHYFCKVFLIL